MKNQTQIQALCEDAIECIHDSKYLDCVPAQRSGLLRALEEIKTLARPPQENFTNIKRGRMHIINGQYFIDTFEENEHRRESSNSRRVIVEVHEL